MAEKQNRTRALLGLGGAGLALWLLIAARRGGSGGTGSGGTGSGSQPGNAGVDVWVRSGDRLELEGVASNIATTVILARAAGRANVHATGDARRDFVDEVIHALRDAGVMVRVDPSLPPPQPRKEQVEVWLRGGDRLELDGAASNLATTVILARAVGRANVHATGDARTGFVGEVINALRAAGVTVWADPSLLRDANYVAAHPHRNAAPRQRGKSAAVERPTEHTDEPPYAWQRGLDMEESRRLAESLNQAARHDEARREAARLNAKPPPELRASVSVDGTRILVDTEANTGAANAAWRALRAANVHIWDTEGSRIIIVGRDSGNHPRVDEVRARTVDVLRTAGFVVDEEPTSSAQELRNAGAKRAGSLPRYDSRRGLWRGGDSRTLYAFTSQLTGVTWVVPGQWTMNYGPQVTVRVATRAEAEEHWQNPLHPGWKVTEPVASDAPRNAAGEPAHVAIFRRVADERFATLRRNELVSTSTSVQGAMASAPQRGDVVVRGEYTSDGTHWGLGRGRVVAQRENGRWTMG